MLDDARAHDGMLHIMNEWMGLDEVDIAAPTPSDDLLDLDEALARLEAEDPAKAQLVKLRYFAGLSEEDAAQALGISRTTAHRRWRYARVWLLNELGEEGGPEEIRRKPPAP